MNRCLHWEDNCSGVSSLFSEASIHLESLMISLSPSSLNVSVSLLKVPLQLVLNLYSVIELLIGEDCKNIQIRARLIATEVASSSSNKYTSTILPLQYEGLKH